MTFVDTSIVVTASQPKDPRQLICLNRLAAVEARGGACSLHSLSEIFAVLTRLLPAYRVPPDAALSIVRHTSQRFKPVALTASEHLSAMERFVAQGLSGAMIYDALILACARKIAATRIYTLNVRHFRLVAPDLASRIVEP